VARSLPFNKAYTDIVGNYQEEKKDMKRYITTVIMFTMLAVMMPLAATTPVEAQSRCYNSRTGKTYLCKKPNFYRRHRKAINILGGAGGGMLLGGLLGGRKGAAIGALAGAGGGYLVTKKQKPKNYVRYYRRY
jgi:hypothetical protein